MVSVRVTLKQAEFAKWGRRWVRTAAHADDEIVRAEPFEAIEIDLLTLWGEERSAPPPAEPVP